MANYTFDSEKHIHYLDGIKIPGVTTILRDMGFISMKFGSEEALYRGSYVHAACDQYNKGILDYEALKPEYRGYVDAWIKFINQGLLDEGSWKSEVNLYSATWKFAGIADLITGCLYDIKTSKQEAKWWKYQSAAYRFMYKEMTGETLNARYSVQLSPEGEYKISEHKGKNDEREFLQILSVYQLKLRETGQEPEGDVQL